MKKSIFLFSILIVLGIISMAQNNTNLQRQDDEGNTMLPHQQGVLQTIEFYDEGYIQSIPSNTYDLYEKSLQKIISAFSQHALLNPPIGFDVQFNKRIQEWSPYIIPNDYPMQEQSSLCASIEIAFAPYYLVEEEAVTDFHISSILHIYLNNPYNILGMPIMADIYPCPKHTTDFHGFPIYQTNRDEFTIINFTKEALFIPVSQEEFIQSVELYWQHKIEKSTAENEEIVLNYEELESEEYKKQQKEDFEKAYQELLKYDIQAAENLKKEYEQAMQMNFDSIQGMSREEAIEGSIIFAENQLLRLRQELNAMSKAERQRQAYYSIDAFEDFNNVSGLLPESHKNAGDALVKINPALVNDKLNQIQLLCLHWSLLNADNRDKPRFQQIADKADLFTDYKMLSLYKDSQFWINLFKNF